MVDGAPVAAAAVAAAASSSNDERMMSTCGSERLAALSAGGSKTTLELELDSDDTPESLACVNSAGTDGVEESDTKPELDIACGAAADMLALGAGGGTYLTSVTILASRDTTVVGISRSTTYFSRRSRSSSMLDRIGLDEQQQRRRRNEATKREIEYQNLLEYEMSLWRT